MWTDNEKTLLYQRILDIEASIKKLDDDRKRANSQDQENEKNIMVLHNKIKEIQSTLDKLEEDVEEKEETVNYVGAIPDVPFNKSKQSFWDKIVDNFPFGVK